MKYLRPLNLILLVSLLVVSPGCRRTAVAPATVPAPTTSRPMEVAVEKPQDPTFARFNPLPVPQPRGLQLQPGDRLAICGDSITEQKMYSRILETYLTVCLPQLRVGVRQYGWGGETAPGFLARMTNDCLRFAPTIATTCYGMNDHGYRPYEEAVGQRYRDASTAIVRAFKNAGARVIQGSPGCVGKKPQWSKFADATVEDLNLNLCALRNIGIEIAKSEQVGFADVFWPMFLGGYRARTFGTDFAVAGKDGVHPDWAGQLIMAYAFLRALGLDGDLGSCTVDLRGHQAVAVAGHEIISFDGPTVRLLSRRYPFCAPAGDATRDNTLRAGMALVPFNDRLNRLLLVAKNGSARSYKITWGTETREYTAGQLARGVNLAADFVTNPFSEAFRKVDEAVAAKQAFETRQIKQLFHGPEGKTDMAGTVQRTEQQRELLVEAVRKAFVPVEHAIRFEAVR